MDMASAVLEALLELLAMFLLLFLVSLEDMLVLADILQTLVELFMLPSVRLRPMLDITMEDMAMVDGLGYSGLGYGYGLGYGS